MWKMISDEKCEKILKTLYEFGGSFGFKKEDFLKVDEFLLFGYPPNRIDLIFLALE
jgi:hypothetical protein